MNRRLLPLSALLALLVNSSEAQDVVHLKNGQSAACEVTALTDNIVTFNLPTRGGPAGGSAKRTIQMSEVAYVEFGFRPGEKAAWEQRDTLDPETLDRWWDFHFAHLHRPRSRTAGFGIALGHSLLRVNEPFENKQALSLFDRIIERAWSEDDRASARQGRLQALIATGDLETAIGEAKLLSQRTEDPELLIEVKFLLAEADFKKLQQLVEDNPRWEEDDEVRPERNELYHRTLDQYLWPHLFHATREAAAARGLLAAGDVYRFGEELERARASYEDLVQLYPQSESATVAKERLDTLSQTSSESAENDQP